MNAFEHMQDDVSKACHHSVGCSEVKELLQIVKEQKL